MKEWGKCEITLNIIIQVQQQQYFLTLADCITTYDASC